MWFILNHLASPKKFFTLSGKLMPWLNVGFLISVVYGLVGALFIAPSDYMQGEGYRIIFIHVPCAFLSLFVYAMMTGAAAMGLIFRMRLAFSVMHHSAVIGAWFTLLALITGSIWGKPMWGTWWIWDARLTSELILLFLYLVIIMLASALKAKQNGNKATALFVLVGFVDLPIIHYSVYWWNTLHQGETIKLFKPSAIDTSMLYPLLSLITAFLFYYVIVLFTRLRHEVFQQSGHHNWLKEKTC